MAILPALSVLLAAAAAALLLSALAEWRQRRLAARRAAGEEARRRAPAEGLKDSWRDARLALALRLDRVLPAPARETLKSRLEAARRGSEPAGGPLVDALLAAAAGLGLGLLLGLGAYALLAAALGLGLPLLRLGEQSAARRRALLRELPDALDLLCACVEAGLGFDQALTRVAARLGHGPLKQELDTALAALRLGATRHEALRELERRCALDEVSALVSALLQADRRGAPLGPALRSQSQQQRVLRSLRVKKMAAEAPLRMLLPLMLFILPVVFIVLFGPILLRWSELGL